MNESTVNFHRMQKCPRFKRCSVPICPLDRLMKQRTKVEGEPKRTLPKNTRLKLGKDLPWKGLWSREISGIRNWENLSEEKKIEVKVRLRKMAFKTR